jgi:predicted AlkP superfamily phosphohydrolase/phosphomutase
MIVVAGIDSGCWEYITPLLEAGRMPNLARLMGQGSFGVLRSTTPPLSPVAWSSFVTGRRPDRHGIFDFWHPEDGSNGGGFRPALASDRQGAPFWQHLNRAGIGCGIVNIPLTHPPQSLEGFLIAGFDAPGSPAQKVYPRDLFDELRASYGPAVLEAPGSELARSDPVAFFEQYALHDRLQTQALIDLAGRLGLGMVAINLMFNDHLSHMMADFSFVERGLEVTDENIGRLRAAFPEANFIVMSDHGSYRTRGTFLLFDWLLRQGLIRLDPRRATATRVNAALRSCLRKRWGLAGYLEKGLRHALKLLLSLLPEAGQEAVVERLSGKDDFYWPWEVIDCAHSPVTMCSPAIGGFYLGGQSGRSVDVPALARLLEGLKDDQGRAIFSKVAAREKLYANGLSRLAPELQASSQLNLYTSARLRRDGPLTVDNRTISYYGNHTPEGVYVLSGPGFNRGVRGQLNIWDVPAMILRLAGLAIPADFEATLPEGVLRQPLEREEAGLAAEAGAGGAAPPTAAEMGDIKERLKGLGYM